MQFNIVQSAAKAIHYANMQSLLNRPMIVDWAVPKNKFSQNNMDVKPEIKTESIDKDEVHDTSEIKIIDSETEDSESDAESDRYLQIQIVCISMDSIYIFFSTSIIISSLNDLFLTFFSLPLSFSFSLYLSA